jgi:hypothetical protein
MAAPSAKNLFKATRRKADPHPELMEIEESRRPKGARRDLDFYPTGQPDAIRALLARDGERIQACGMVWEPAVGAGDLAKPMIDAGLTVVGSDVVDRGWPDTAVRSFYEFERAEAPAIITNPPYSEINARDGHGRWLRHTLALPEWDYCALLLSWDWPAAKQNGLGALLDENPFSYCYLMRWKLDFTGEGSPPQRNAWFVWDRRWTGREPAFRFLDRVDDRQGEIPL